MQNPLNESFEREKKGFVDRGGRKDFGQNIQSPDSSNFDLRASQITPQPSIGSENLRGRKTVYGSIISQKTIN